MNVETSFCFHNNKQSSHNFLGLLLLLVFFLSGHTLVATFVFFLGESCIFSWGEVYFFLGRGVFFLGESCIFSWGELYFFLGRVVFFLGEKWIYSNIKIRNGVLLISLFLKTHSHTFRLPPQGAVRMRGEEVLQPRWSVQSYGFHFSVKRVSRFFCSSSLSRGGCSHVLGVHSSIPPTISC